MVALNLFLKDRKAKDGHRGTCKLCARKWYKKYYKKNKLALIAYKNNNYNSLKRRQANLKRLYNLSWGELGLMILEQDYKCLICNQVKKLVPDHCHKTNRVRGLLCANCNSLLGFAADDPTRLLNAVAYLNNAIR